MSPSLCGPNLQNFTATRIYTCAIYDSRDHVEQNITGIISFKKIIEHSTTFNETIN